VGPSISEVKKRIWWEGGGGRTLPFRGGAGSFSRDSRHLLTANGSCPAERKKFGTQRTEETGGT